MFAFKSLAREAAKFINYENSKSQLAARRQIPIASYAMGNDVGNGG